jgi:transcriptional regulator with XRE-family HTH domain
MLQNQTLGDRIKEERRRLGLTQQQFADGLEISRSAITFYETDRTVPDGNFFSRALENGVDVLYILKGERSVEAAAYMLDWKFLDRILLAVRAWCEAAEIVIHPSRELEIAQLLYKNFSKRGLIDQDFLDQTMRLAA